MKFFRQFLAKTKHFHKFSPKETSKGMWRAVCSCGNQSEIFEERKVREICWKNNVHSGNVKANYINNGVAPQTGLGIKL